MNVSETFFDIEVHDSANNFFVVFTFEDICQVG